MGFYTIADGEIVESLIIAKHSNPYLKVTIIIDGDNIDDDTIEATSDGTNWETVSNNTEYTFTNTGTHGIMYRITSGVTSSVVRSVKIKYI